MSKSLYLISCLLVVFYTNGIKAQTKSKQLYLSELELEKIVQPYWSAQKDKAINGTTFSINGKEYKRGIGTMSNSKIFISLDGKAETFSAFVGLQDVNLGIEKLDVKFNALGDGSKLFYTENNNKKQFVGIAQTVSTIAKGSVKFIIKGDGEKIWESKIITSGDKKINVNVDIKNIHLLELVVDDNGDGISGDNANWIKPLIIYQGEKPKIIDENQQDRRQVSSVKLPTSITASISRLPKASSEYINGVSQDWLVRKVDLTSGIFRGKSEKEILISNGLISRTFRITPNCATVDYKNLINNERLIRGVSPEAILVINGKEYKVGGLDGQIEYGYLKEEWIEEMWSPNGAFKLINFTVDEITPRVNWKNKRWSRIKKGKIKGKSINFVYTHTDFPGLKVNIHYNIYDGIPLISKWFTISNSGSNSVVLNSFKSEILAFVEAESSVEKQSGWKTPNIHIESDFAFHSMSMENANKVVHWETDPRYTSQASYLLNTPCLLECKLPIGPDETIKSGGSFESFRIWELPFDSYDKQRKGLYTNKMYETISPWVTENPLFMHLTTTRKRKVIEAIDQCAETGYEMLILSFGSGLNIEKDTKKNISKFKAYADYAHSKGIEIGGYSLLSSRWISDEVDVINPETGKRGGTIHGSSPCLNSQWGIDYFDKLNNFFDKTGFDLLEHDGSYPGQLCASTKHIGHKGLEDSQWKAWKRITNFYKECNAKGISLNIPDWYYLSGSTKNGIGYREVNWSLPRDRQLVLGRQNMYDGTYDRLPSMSWTFVPLTQYHGGGESATIEPLDQHLDAYKAHMMQNYGMGVQACYRGPRLYDTERTKQTVIKVVKWYKKYRDILNSPIIHLKRPDGRDIDGVMHVNAELKERGFIMLFNPTDSIIRKKINIPLYYTGLETSAYIREKEGEAKQYKLNRDYSVDVEVEVPANGYNWFVIEAI